MGAESLTLAIAQRMTRITVGTLFKTLEKIVAIENKLSATPGNVFNIGECNTQLYSNLAL
jgi:hypothetical protein